MCATMSVSADATIYNIIAARGMGKEPKISVRDNIARVKVLLVGRLDCFGHMRLVCMINFVLANREVCTHR